MGASAAVTGGHGKFCVFGAGKGGGKGQRNQHHIPGDKLPLQQVSGPRSPLRPPLPALPEQTVLRRSGSPTLPGPGRAHHPPRRLPARPAPWQARCTQVFKSMQREPAVRRETHFLKCYFNSYAFTFMCLREKTTTPQTHGLTDTERTGLTHLGERG